MNEEKSIRVALYAGFLGLIALIIGFGLWLLIGQSRHEPQDGPAVAAAADGQPAPKAPLSPGERLARANDCFTCHQIETGILGPPYREIAKRYEPTEATIAALVNKVIEGGTGNWQGKWAGKIMTPHTHLEDDQVRLMVEWILSLDEGDQ